MVELLNKLDDIAKCAASPRAIALPPRIDVKRRPGIVVEGTEPLERRAGRAQIDVAADDIDDVVGFLDALGQGYPIFRQRAPLDSVRSVADRKCNSQAHRGRPMDCFVLSIGKRRIHALAPILGSGTKVPYGILPSRENRFLLHGCANPSSSTSRIVVRPAKSVKRGRQ